MNALWDVLPDDLKANPFFHYSAETNYVPAWDKIRFADAKPAIDFALDVIGRTAIWIAENEEPPTFENTVEPLEEAFALVGYFWRILYALTPKDKEEEKIRDTLEKELTLEWHDAFYAIFSHIGFFERYVNLGIENQGKKWSREQAMVAGMYYNGFIESGIKLDSEKRKAYQKNQRHIAELGIKIQQKMRDAGEKTMVIVDDPQRLKGVPDDLMAQAAALADSKGKTGQWAFLSNRVIFETLMRTAEDTGFRKTMWNHYYKGRMTKEFNTSPLIMKFAKLTHDGARLKSGTTPATEILFYTMAKTSRTVSKFLLELRDAAMPVAKQELQAMSDFAGKNLGLKKLQAWDLDFVKERMKKSILGISEQDMRPYFELENTLEKGIFPHFKKQLGLTFKRTDRHPNYHEDVRAYDISTKSGRHMGVLFLDLYDRPGKMAGIAWSMSVLPQGKFEGRVRRPVNQINMKLTKPPAGEPTLMTHDDVATIMHELGHSLHDIKSECVYPSRSGTSVHTDFVEFPSQFQEYISFEPAFLKKFARHHITNEPMSDEVLQKIQQSRKFMAGRSVLERAMRGWLDFQWHNKNPDSFTSVKAFERDTLKSFKLPGIEYPLYSPAFSYTFGGGYDSSFYSYQWSQVMSDDLLAKFNKKGLYHKDLTAKFSKALANGGSVDEHSNYRKIAGRKPTLKPFLRAAGLLGNSFNYDAIVEVLPIVAANDEPMLTPPEQKLDIA